MMERGCQQNHSLARGYVKPGGMEPFFWSGQKNHAEPLRNNTAVFTRPEDDGGQHSDGLAPARTSSSGLPAYTFP